jgi:hypothetical protein
MLDLKTSVKKVSPPPSSSFKAGFEGYFEIDPLDLVFELGGFPLDEAL